MANYLVVQLGGSTTAINASLVGVVRANQLNPVYSHVYGELNGIEGILEDRLYGLTDMSEYEDRLLRQTSPSAPGNCRYKLKRNDETDYRELAEIMDKHDIKILFYIGGNDSMGTADALSQWVRANSIDKHFVGTPKTVDNDLMVTDHCPGFASGAKFANEVVNATWLDYNVYIREEVSILETTGRDAGWPAGPIVVTGRVDLIVSFEVNFDKGEFPVQVKKCMDKEGKCYIVISEGAHYADSTYIAAGEAVNDGFGHAVLGGAGENLKNMILEAGIAPRVKVQDLSTATRSSNFAQPLVDVIEVFEPDTSAYSRSVDDKFIGHVVVVQREYVNGRYNAKFISGPAKNFANHVKHVPAEWILPDYQGLTQEFYDYTTPLIQGEPTLIMENGVPKTIVPFNKRQDYT